MTQSATASPHLRWNGWGSTDIDLPLPPQAHQVLSSVLGSPTPPTDIAWPQLRELIHAQQPSRIPLGLQATAGLDLSPEIRFAHSHGHSCEDWIRMRFGVPDRLVDGVVFPESTEALRGWMSWAAEHSIAILPVGGATSVAGHLRVQGKKPVLAVSLRRLNRLIHLDPVSQIARMGAGAIGPEVEAQLRTHGFTLGHFPQSFEQASLGGWVVTRSSGQQSGRYGRIEQMFAGGLMLTPTGELRIPPLPASAAGPDVREWVLGSEGRLGILAEVDIRITPLADQEEFLGVFFPSWTEGMAATRAMAQERVGASMVRLSNALETDTNLRMAHSPLIPLLSAYMRLRGCGQGRVMMTLGFTGSRAQVSAQQQHARAIWSRHGGVSAGTLVGKAWAAKRYKGVYLRNSLWEAGFVVDTMETAVPWPQVQSTMNAIEQAGRDALASFGEKAYGYTHLSHVYPTGSSVYSTFVFRVGPDANATLARWRALKTAVSQAIADAGGTVSHQHGVGQDHAPWLGVEKGSRGMQGLSSLVGHFDPEGLMAPGNLLLDGIEPR